MKLLLTALILTFTVSAHAQKIDCNEIAGLAESIMAARQSGMGMPEAMEIAKDTKIVQQMVVGAYEVPRYSTEEYQQRKIADYRDTWYLACYQAMND